MKKDKRESEKEKKIMINRRCSEFVTSYCGKEII